VIAGRAARRLNVASSPEPFHMALSLSEEHQLPIWQVFALAELGANDRTTGSDLKRSQRAQKLATSVGMVGMVVSLDMSIGLTIAMREGYVSAYPTLARAEAQARQLQLVGLHARALAHIAQCLVEADGPPLPGRAVPATSDVDDLVAEAIALGKASHTVPWAKSALGMRAWCRGDTSTAIRLLDESLSPLAGELKQNPWFGVLALLRVVTDYAPEEALDALAADNLTGHHANWAALAYGQAVLHLRSGRPAHELISEADERARQAPFMRHLLRTIIAPTVFAQGLEEAQGWLLEADAFCNAHGERALQRRVRAGLSAIGARIPRAAPGVVPPHLARVGITPREIEILRLVNSGLSNPDIATRLFISVRTVETHVSSMLQKTGLRSREQLPSADARD
jgi:DNA-binding CsgD family transcriptional regulator